MFKGSWKTTLAGIATILGGIGQINFATVVSQPEQLAMLLAGIGLLFARDNNVSSEDAGAK